jgi:hypothetical protein
VDIGILTGSIRQRSQQAAVIDDARLATLPFYDFQLPRACEIAARR